MAYCTQTDIINQIEEKKLEGLTDDAGAGEVDADIVTRSIADADATIDAYCQGQYTVPLSPITDKIRQISVDIAIYNLYTRRSVGGVPEIRSERYKEAIRFLEQVASGKITLGADTPAPANTENTVSISGNDRIFDRTKMSGF